MLVRGRHDVHAVGIVAKVSDSSQRLGSNLWVGRILCDRRLVIPAAAELVGRIGDVGLFVPRLFVVLRLDVVMSASAHGLGIGLEQGLQAVGISVLFVIPKYEIKLRGDDHHAAHIRHVRQQRNDSGRRLVSGRVVRAMVEHSARIRPVRAAGNRRGKDASAAAASR